ncbi:unnamed protein product [Rhizoctonia solani]|uniref:Uncharacterized protein n=1 Tax=Rhizoctonia solani TaxID=456999 RepID=A0A8H3C1R4_9AGAM|nr:unnamed protein product [Rhizoctonia solani]
MIKAHPLASLVEALGFNPELRGTDSNEVSQHVVNFLENCPFPDVQTVSKWSWIADTIETEVTLQEIDNLFCANLVDIDDRAFHWRRDIEKQLLTPILSERTQSNELDPDDLNSEVIFKLTVKGSAPPLKMIGPLTRFLLRADTIFRQIREDPKINEDFVYYPYLTSTFGSYYWVDDELLKVTPSSYHRHELAEKVSRALLKGIEMVDASHLELAVMGDVFVCGRCRLQKAKSWQGMVQHYLDELRSWSVSLLVYPRFKTRHPTGYYNAHSITCSIDNSPLTRVATDQEVTEMNMESVQLDNPISCIPCKNYARMYVSTNMEAMECHLERA